jgi:hypothetical protein
MSQAPGWKICDYCGGTGKITTEEGCPTCAGSGSVTATVTISGRSTWRSSDNTKIYVSAQVENKENVAVYGTFTATIEAAFKKYETTPRAVTLAANERTTLTFTFDKIPSSDIYRADPESAHILVSNLPTVACSTCNGTGIVSVESTCPVCSGTGFVSVEGEQPNGNGNTNAPPLDISVPAIGVGAVAVVAVAAVVVVKKRKVSEKDLRKLPPTEFQNWVLKKLAGKPAPPGDCRIGIDGYTTEGQPISIKQSDGVGRDVIDKFASAIGQSRAKNGILIAYSFGNDAYTAKVKAKLNYGLEIQLVTLKELIESGKKPL